MWHLDGKCRQFWVWLSDWLVFQKFYFSRRKAGISGAQSVKSFYVSETGLNYTLPRGDIHNDYIIVPRFTYNSRIPEHESQLSWKKWTLFWFWLLYDRWVWQTKMGVLRLGKPFWEIFMFIGFDYWSSSWEQPLGNLPNRQNLIENEGTNYQFSFVVV